MMDDTTGTAATKRRARIAAGRRAMPLLVLAVALAVYLSTDQRVNYGDTIPSSLIPVTLLLHGTVRMDAFVPPLEKGWGGGLPYFFRQTPPGVLSHSPLATGLLATPILALPVLVTAGISAPTPEEWLDHAHRMQLYAAAIITAATA